MGRTSLPMLGRAEALAVCLLAVGPLAGCGSSSTSTAAAPPAPSSPQPAKSVPAAGGWTGLGAPLASFEAAHPKNLAHCPAGTCFGPQLTNSEGTTDEFTTLETTGGPDNRVDGYTQALPDGTNVNEAKSEVLALMPKDTKTTAFFIQHDSLGATCAFWNVQSDTLGKWFSSRKVGDAGGVMGIELSTLDASGNVTYEAGHVTTADVSLAAVNHSINC